MFRTQETEAGAPSARPCEPYKSEAALARRTMKLSFADVHVYEARNNYWAGRILDGISGGGSLYLKDQPWGFDIECLPDGTPHLVRFQNNSVFSFCGLRASQLQHEWPLFLEDYAAFKATGKGKMIVRAERIFSDSLHMDLVSDRACVHDVLIWHYPPAYKNAAPDPAQREDGIHCAEDLRRDQGNVRGPVPAAGVDA